LELEHLEREKRDREMRELRDRELSDRLKDELMKNAVGAGPRMPNTIDPHWLELHRRYVTCLVVDIFCVLFAAWLLQRDASVAGTLVLDQVVLHRGQHCTSLASSPHLQDQARQHWVSWSGNDLRD
jgi:hypothetical protein